GTLEGEVLVGRAWARRASGRDGGYLFAIEPSLGLLQALFASIRDLRLAGLDGVRLRADAFEVGAKGQELGELLDAFVSELRAAGRVDHADVLRMAIGRLRTDPHALGTDAVVLLPADAELTRLERDLASALPAGMLHRLPVDEPLTALPQSTDLALLRWLPKPPDAPTPASDGTARIARAIGEPNEVRQVFRRILAEGLALDDVELLHTDADTYVPLVYELAAGLRHDATDGGALPVTFVEGIPVRYTRPGRALTAWLAWQRGGYPQSILVRMLQDGLLHLPEGEGAAPSGPQLASLLRPIPIGRGRERTLAAIDAGIAALAHRARQQDRRTDEDGESFGQPAAELRRRRAAMQALRALVAELLAATPDAGASQADTLSAARTFLKRLVRCAGEDDEYARLRLVEEIEKLEAWVSDGEEVACLDAAEWLAGLPTGVRIKGSGPRPGCLHVASVGTGGHSGRRHTFIVGLDDGRFPGQGGQDPVLLDGERQQLSGELPTAAGRLQEKVARFARLLARLRGSATLSYSCRSLDDDREMFASPVVLAAYRILSGERDGDHAALDRWLEPPASFAPELPEACLDDAEWWLWRFCGPEAVGNTVEVLREHFPRLVHGREAERRRDAASVTHYDGLVPEAGAENDPTAPDGPVVSASRLQTLGACPLRYFFRYILRLEPPEELESD
ncbi:PD-(D/E)XK nuclease family protein, partial [bacterium]|nr:PD-(D/E)XK nuclease family protein [bacterium]